MTDQAWVGKQYVKYQVASEDVALLQLYPVESLILLEETSG